MGREHARRLAVVGRRLDLTEKSDRLRALFLARVMEMLSALRRPYHRERLVGLHERTKNLIFRPTLRAHLEFSAWTRYHSTMVGSNYGR